MAIDFFTLRTRHIPALWPIVSYWSGGLGKAIGPGVELGVVVNTWRNGDYTAHWENRVWPA